VNEWRATFVARAWFLPPVPRPILKVGS